MKPQFITVEGIEGVGKTTCMEYLKQYMQENNIPSVFTREPGGTVISEAIRQVVLSHYSEKMCDDTELLLYFAARAQHIHALIKPNLSEGKFVISDRFTDASYAYQSGGRGLPEERIEVLEKFVQGDLQPDITLLLTAPVDIALHRTKQRSELDRIEVEKEAFFVNVQENYLKRAKQYPNRFKIIDAARSVSEVQQQIKEVMDSII
ncbi:MAG: dTMP kinase [Gammaproteobacteria bacterium]